MEAAPHVEGSDMSFLGDANELTGESSQSKCEHPGRFPTHGLCPDLLHLHPSGVHYIGTLTPLFS